jgi:predicted Zn-dependent protease
MGAVRLFQVLERQGGNNLIPFFQTHPNPSERIENARQTAQ